MTLTLKKQCFSPCLAMPKTKREKRRVREPTAPGGGQVRPRDTGHGPGGSRGQAGVESGADLADLEKLAGASTPDQRGRGGLRRSARLSRARSASQSWTGRVRVTFTSDSCAAMKHIEDLGFMVWTHWPSPFTSNQMMLLPGIQWCGHGSKR